MSLDALLAAHRTLVILVSLAGAAGMIAFRLREARRAVTPVRIVIPPLAMSSGFAMFAVPATRIPWGWGAAAFLAGAAVLAVPLVRTSTLVASGDEIVVQRSRAFLWVLLGLLAVRFALRAYIERHVTPAQTGALFFVLAFGMVARWRAGMLLDYRRLRAV